MEWNSQEKGTGIRYRYQWCGSSRTAWKMPGAAVVLFDGNEELDEAACDWKSLRKARDRRLCVGVLTGRSMTGRTGSGGVKSGRSHGSARCVLD